MSQSNNQTINQSNDRPINQSIKRSTNQSIKRSIDQSNDRSTNQSINLSICRDTASVKLSCSWMSQGILDPNFTKITKTYRESNHSMHTGISGLHAPIYDRGSKYCFLLANHPILNIPVKLTRYACIRDIRKPEEDNCIRVLKGTFFRGKSWSKNEKTCLQLLINSPQIRWKKSCEFSPWFTVITNRSHQMQSWEKPLLTEL